MNAVHTRQGFAVLVSVVAFACAVTAAAQKVERIGPAAAAVSDDLHRAVEDTGYRVTLDDGWAAELWFARQLKIEKKEAPGALYPELSTGEFMALVNLPKGMTDYRGQRIAAGIYTLRYQTLPQDGNHMGVAPNPDFLLAIPAAADSTPEQSYAFKKLVALSAKSTGTNHPAVIALESPGEAAAVTKDERGESVFTAAVPCATGIEKIGIVLKGAAAQ